VKYDFVFSHSGTHLGLLWWLLEPVLLLCVYTVLVTLLRPRVAGLTYVIGLGATLIPWQWFAKTILRSGTSVISSSGLILNVVFPKISIIIADVLSNTIFAVFGLGIVIAVSSFVNGRFPSQAILFLPLICLVQLLLTVAVTLIYVTAYMWIRDLHNVAQFLLRLGWFVSPGLWTLEMIRDKSQLVHAVVWANPFTTLMVSYRNVVAKNITPPLVPLGILALVSVTVLLLGMRIFDAHEPKFAKMV
jgi:lipopolysaccharide transport system permease protein/teichoic acid transport system permease protein